MNVNGYETKASVKRALKAKGHKFVGLLARPESNPKVAKNMKKAGVMTAPLHLAPAKVSGFEVCPQRSQGCTMACLHTAGNPAYMAQKFNSRNDKTRAYFTARPEFMALIVFEIAALARKAAAANMESGIRLNATSDIAWERVPVTIDGESFPNVMAAFPDVQFYDYTKVTKRALSWARGTDASGRAWPENYHLTFSKTEENDSAVIAVLKAGGNVAIVFDKAPEYVQTSQGALVSAGGPNSADWLVIDGDSHDYRPADPRGVIVGLKAKGLAKKDESGFVMRLGA